MKRKEKTPVAGIFDPEASLMWQLELLDNEEIAEKWYKDYLNYHNGIDQGVSYCIGYFASSKRRNNLKKWIYKI